MCAAPGSKTAQLIEMLHADMEVPFPGKKHRFKNRKDATMTDYSPSLILSSTLQRALLLPMTWTTSAATCSCTKPSVSTARALWWSTTTPPASPRSRSTQTARRTSSSTTESCATCPAGQQRVRGSPLKVSWSLEVQQRRRRRRKRIKKDICLISCMCGCLAGEGI